MITKSDFNQLVERSTQYITVLQDRINELESQLADFEKRLGGADSHFCRAFQMIRSVHNCEKTGSKKIARTKPYLDEKKKREYRSKRIESKNRYGVLRD